MKRIDEAYEKAEEFESNFLFIAKFLLWGDGWKAPP